MRRETPVMPNSLAFDLQEHGWLARSTTLRALGHTRRTLESEQQKGVLLRPVKPWIATRAAARESVIAVLHRGILTSASALRSYGIWAGLDSAIHVLSHPHADRSRAVLAVPLSTFRPTNAHSRGVVRHWARQHSPNASGPEWRVSVFDALMAFSIESSPEYAVAAIDSALHVKALRPRELRSLVALLPARLRGIGALIDGRAESGTESLARCRIAELGCRFDIQVKIGEHRVDILIDGWLVVEIDSEEWHGSDRLADSRRTNWLIGEKYGVLHFDYDEVMFDWPSCERALLEQLRTRPPVHL